VAATIPNIEPVQITAGDTAEWTRRLTDYPAPDWVLTYAFISVPIAGDPILIEADDDGDDHLVTIEPATTELWVAGEYNGQGYVTKTATGERRHIWSGKLTINPNFVSAGQIDTRTNSRRILDLIERSLERLAAKQTTRVTIEGVSFEFQDIEKLLKLKAHYLNEVLNEEAAAAGMNRKVILARFRAPSQWAPDITFP